MTSPTTLKFLSWNINHANSPLGPYSTKILDPRFLNVTNSHDIVCLQETKSEVKIPNFLCWNSLRPDDNRSAGVCIGFKRSISSGVKRVPGVSKSPDIIIVRLDRAFFHRDRHLYLITAYIPPANSSSKFKRKNPAQDTLGDILKEISSLPQDADLIICGDLNARSASKPDYVATDQRFDHLPVDVVGVSPLNSRNSEDKTTNRAGKDLLDLCITANLLIANGRSVGDVFGSMTCHKWNGSSLVDYFITSSELRKDIFKLKVEEFTDLSDHAPVSLHVNLARHSLTTPESRLPDLDDAPQRFKWDERSPGSFKEAQEDPNIRLRILSSLSSDCSPQSTGDSLLLYQSFSNIMSDICRKALRKPKTSRPRPPKNKWYGGEQSRLSRACDNLAESLGKHPGNGPLRDQLFEAKKAYRKSSKTAKRLHNRKAMQDIEDGKNLNWKQFKRHKQELSPKVAFDNHDLLAFYHHFKSLYETKKTIPILSESELASSVNNPSSVYSPDQEILDAIIDTDEVTATIKVLQNGKSVGPDLISNEMLKNISPDLMALLVKLLNACLSSGIYPWTTSFITPIPKGGDKYDPNNYRAIAIGSAVGKLYSSILLNRLVTFRNLHCKDPPNQLGFCKDAQCNDHIFTLRTVYEKFVVKKKTKVISCFVDFAKAFDSLSREALLYKIVNLGITGKFFKTLRNMYQNTCSRVKLINKLSKSIDHNNGVEQGHPLSPELFKLFIRELSALLNAASKNPDMKFPHLSSALVNHLLWADDLVLLALDEKSLQALLTILGKFCEDWGLVVNLKKTKILTFTRSGRLLQPKSPLKIGESTIEATKSYTYLGIMITPNFNLKLSQDALRKKGLKAYFGLKRVININDLSIKGATSLFDALVKPVILYGAQIWADKCHLTKVFENYTIINSMASEPSSPNRDLRIAASLKKIALDSSERIHLLTLKWTLGVHRKTSNLAVWGDTGRYPLAIEALKLATDYFSRLESLPSNSLTHHAFRDQQSLNLDWFKTMNLLTSSYRQSSDVDATRCQMELIFRKLWSLAVRASPKLSFYASLKTSFKREPYLNLSKKKPRDSIARLRASAHDLEIERGRYAETPRDQRLCKGCLALGHHDIEDELHMLAKCTVLADLRADLPHQTLSLLTLNGLQDTFSDRAQCPQSQALKLKDYKKIGTFIFACFEKRKLVLDSLGNN